MEMCYPITLYGMKKLINDYYPYCIYILVRLGIIYPDPRRRSNLL